MAAPYTLPSSALPHAHQKHMHSHSQSQTSLNAWRAGSTESLVPSIEEHQDESAPNQHYTHRRDSSHSHSHSHSHQHQHHARTGSHASNRSATRDRPRPVSLDVMDGWTLGKTTSGKSVIAHDGELASATPYSPPRQKHDNMHSLPTDRNAERSMITAAILPYTARFPIIHAIMTEKDSRRIFYFMMCVFHLVPAATPSNAFTDSISASWLSRHFTAT